MKKWETLILQSYQAIVRGIVVDTRSISLNKTCYI